MDDFEKKPTDAEIKGLWLDLWDAAFDKKEDVNDANDEAAVRLYHTAYEAGKKDAQSSLLSKLSKEKAFVFTKEQMEKVANWLDDESPYIVEEIEAQTYSAKDEDEAREQEMKVYSEKARSLLSSLGSVKSEADVRADERQQLLDRLTSDETVIAVASFLAFIETGKHVGDVDTLRNIGCMKEARELLKAALQAASQKELKQ